MTWDTLNWKNNYTDFWEKLLTLNIPSHMQAAVRTRTELLYDLAKQATVGNIVEIGTYHGYGAFALAAGSMVGRGWPIFTFDDYAERTGWIGEMYGHNDELQFLLNLRAMDMENVIIQVGMAGWDGAVAFNAPVGLVFLDLPTYDLQKSCFDIWLKRLRHGGKFLMRDTSDGKLGSEKLANAAVERGEARHVNIPQRNFYLLEKV